MFAVACFPSLETPNKFPLFNGTVLNIELSVVRHSSASMIVFRSSALWASLILFATREPNGYNLTAILIALGSGIEENFAATYRFIKGRTKRKVQESDRYY